MKIFINRELITAIREAEQRQLISAVADLMELGMGETQKTYSMA